MLAYSFEFCIFLKDQYQLLFWYQIAGYYQAFFPYLGFLFKPNLQYELPCLFPLTEVKFCVQLVFITSVLGIPHTNRPHPHDVDTC